MPATTNLSQNQINHLIAVDEASEVDWTAGEVSRYFVPLNGLKHVRLKRTDRDLIVSGSTSASALKSLEKRGLIRYADNNMAKFAYYFVITEEGRQEVERLAESGVIPHYA